MTTKSPLYFTGKTPEGKLLLGGVFKMHDQEGFPIEASFEEAKLKGWEIDWMEALADCWLNGCQKFDDFVAKAECLSEHTVQASFSFAGAMWLGQYKQSESPESPVDEFCRHILEQKRANAIHP